MDRIHLVPSRLTAATILSGSAVQVDGLGSRFVSAIETVDGGLEIDHAPMALVADVLTEGPSMILILARTRVPRASRSRAAGTRLAHARRLRFKLRADGAPGQPCVADRVECRRRYLAVPASVAAPRCRYAVAFMAPAHWRCCRNLIAGSLLPQGGSLAFQTMFGIGVMKCASAVDSAGVAQSLVIPNPWCTELSSYASAWMWHVAHQWNSLATMAAHRWTRYRAQVLLGADLL